MKDFIGPTEITDKMIRIIEYWESKGLKEHRPTLEEDDEIV